MFNVPVYSLKRTGKLRRKNLIALCTADLSAARDVRERGIAHRAALFDNAAFPAKQGRRNVLGQRSEHAAEKSGHKRFAETEIKAYSALRGTVFTKAELSSLSVDSLLIKYVCLFYFTFLTQHLTLPLLKDFINNYLPSASGLSCKSKALISSKLPRYFSASPP